MGRQMEKAKAPEGALPCSRTLAVLDSELNLDDEQIQLDAETQVDFAKVFSECFQTTRCDAT